MSQKNQNNCKANKRSRQSLKAKSTGNSYHSHYYAPPTPHQQPQYTYRHPSQQPQYQRQPEQPRVQYAYQRQPEPRAQYAYQRQPEQLPQYAYQRQSVQPRAQYAYQRQPEQQVEQQQQQQCPDFVGRFNSMRPYPSTSSTSASVIAWPVLIDTKRTLTLSDIEKGSVHCLAKENNYGKAKYFNEFDHCDESKSDDALLDMSGSNGATMEIDAHGDVQDALMDMSRSNGATMEIDVHGDAQEDEKLKVFLEDDEDDEAEKKKERVGRVCGDGLY